MSDWIANPLPPCPPFLVHQIHRFTTSERNRFRSSTSVKQMPETELIPGIQ